MQFDFSEVLTRAWQITWKHKILWAYGFLLTMFGFLFIPLSIIPVFAPDISDRMIDEPWLALILVAGFFVFILALYPVSVIMNGALTVGVLRAERGEDKLSFMELIRESFPFFWRILGLMLLYGVAMIIAMLAFSALQVILTLVTFGLAAICMVPLSFLTYPVIFIWYACMEQSMTAIVADNMNIMDAAQQGWQIFRKNIGAVAIVGLVLYLGVSFISGFAMLPMLAPFLAIPFALESIELNTNIFLVAVICAAVYGTLFLILQGGILAFMKAGWVLTYLHLTRSLAAQPVLLEAASS